MLSDAFPPFSGEMKGAKTAAAEIRCSIRPPSQTSSLKIYATDESQPFGVEERGTLMLGSSAWVMALSIRLATS